MQKPELVAHRGYAGRYPENSHSAVRAALELGARWVEIDVQLTRDQQVVLFHDRTLDRVCGEQGSIHERRLDELKHLRLRETDRFGSSFEDEPIATLRQIVELFEQHTEAQLFVEIKRIAIEQHGAEGVLAAVQKELESICSRTILISFSSRILELGRHDSRIGLILETWDQASTMPVSHLAPEFLFCNHTKFPDEGSLELPPRLATYEVVDPAQALALAERGVELVETFEFELMLEGLR